MTEGAHLGPSERLHQALAQLADVQLLLEKERWMSLETELQFAAVLDAMSDALLITDPTSRLVRVNLAAEHLLGMPREQLLGRPVAEFAGQGVPPRLWDLVRLEQEGTLTVKEASVRRPDGTTVPVSLAVAVVRTPSGKVLGSVYSLRDLSQTQRLLRELAEAEARWHLLAEVSDDLISGLETRADLGRVCQRVAGVTGFVCGIALLAQGGVVVHEVVVAGEEPLRTGLEQALATNPPGGALRAVLTRGASVHVPARRSDYPLFAEELPEIRSVVLSPLEARGEILGALVFAAGEPDRIGGAALSLAEQVGARIALALGHARLHAELAQLEAAREADSLRHELFSAVTHDVLTPISAIKGAAKVLALEDRQVSGVELAVLFNRQADHLQRLVQGILDFMRIQEGRPLSLQVKPVEVRSVLREAAILFAPQRRIEVEEPDGGLHVLADAERLRQALGNLISNAVKYSQRETPVWIGARDSSGRVEMWVRDQGTGIAPGDLAHLFERFFRGSQERRSQGTGLGLYLTKEIVQAMGGEISCESKPGRGSTFTISLPRAEVAS
jgi:PAS domain S-box-containing protein